LTTTLLLAIALGAVPGAGEHLLAGATAFREGKFAAALVEFRVAERLGADEARPYAGATLVKLGRHEEAIEAFGPAPAPDEDALLSWYRALALRAAGLLATADAALASIGDRSGPRIAGEVARLRAELAAALGQAPPAEKIDAALARGTALRGAGRLALSAAHYREAAALAARRPDRHRHDEAARASEELGALAARRKP
jgi:tetratricopeptide (TPR) repeat protein